MGNADLRWLLKDAWQGLARRIGNARPAAPATPAAPRRAVFEEVEARLLYSADLAPGLADSLAQTANISYIDSTAATTTQVTNQVAAAPLSLVQNPTQIDNQANVIAAQTNAASTPQHQIVFIDTSVDQWQTLLADVQKTQPDAEVVMINATQDGITQITDALAQRSDISAIHLITHGTAGDLQIGGSDLNAATLANYASDISSWRSALAPDANILLYGCDFAANDVGKALTNDLSALTGANVAASEDMTGNAALGGNWTLEYSTGHIDTDVVIDAATQQSWDSTLSIQQDSVSSAATNTSGATSLTFSATVGTGANRILIVEVALRFSAGASSVTYGGVALTKLSSVTDSTNVVTAEIWYLKAPASGTANVVVTLPTPHEFVAGATSFSNVDQTTPFGTAVVADGSGTTTSVTVASTTNDVVIDVAASRLNTSAAAGGAQTALWTQENGPLSNDAWGGVSTQAGAASVTANWTISSSAWAATAVSMNSAPNTAPVVTDTGTTLSYTENAAATAIDNAVTVTDDGINLTGATVKITTNYQNGQDVLAFTNQLGITGSWNAATGTLTLSGTTTVANYQTALRAVTYQNTSDNPSTLTRTATFTANDGSLTGNDTRNISVTAVDDAPVVTNTTTTLSYTENAAATTIDNALTVTDVDSANLTGATVKITTNYQNGQDVLAFTNQLGITGSWNAATGTLTLSGTTTVANYQTALRAVTYQNTSDNPSTLTRTATFTANDGSLTGNDTRNISVAAVNDPPIVTNTGTALSYTENATATAIDNALTVTDADSSNLTGATVQLTGNYQNGQDVLAFTNQLGIAGSWNAATGMLTLTGTTTAANYQTALRAVTYVNTSDNPSTLARTVTFTANDGSLTGNDTRNINVTAVNDAPVITSNGGSASASVSIAENSTAVATVTATDAENNTLTYSISGGADAAKFIINSSTGALAFAAAPDFETPTDVGGNNVYDVTVQVSDGSLTDTQAIAVTVTNVNEAPVITSNSGGASASVNVAENSTAVTTVTATDVDASTTLTYSISGGADAAKFTINSSTGALTFLSAPNFESPTDAGANNVYDVTVQVSDGALTDTQAIAVTVTNVNEAPVITSNSGGASAATSTAENSSAVTTVTATDVDASTTLTYSIAGGADAAKFTINSSTGVLTFLSAPDFETPTDAGGNNVYDVTVQVSDGTLVDTQAIAVTVTNVNEPPSGTDKTITTNEDTAYTFTAADFGFSDVDAGDTMSAVRIDSVPGAGSLTLSGVAVTAAQVITTANIGNLVFTPAANANGAAYASFTFSVRDQSSTYDTAPNAITVNVTAVNDAPTGANKTITTNEDTAYTFTAADFGFSDVDTGDTISAVRIDGVPGAGSLTLSGVGITAGQVIATANIGNLVFTPAANANGTGYTSFTFSVRDQSSAYDAAPNTLTFNVTAVNDGPVNSVPGAQATDEDTALVFSSGNGNLISISDVDAGASSVQVTVSVSHGTLTLSGIAGLSFSSGDGTADGSMVFTGTLSNINAALAGLSYLPAADYNGSDTLSIITSDQGNTGSGGAKSDTDNISITVNPVNDSPVNSVPGAQTVNEDTALAISTISVNDADDNLVSVALGVLHGTLTIGLSGAASITAGANGTAALTITGVQADINATLTSLTYQGVLNYNGSDTLSVLSTDSDGATDSDTVGITVTAVNDNPVNTNPGAQATDEDTALVFSTGNGNPIQISDVDAVSGSLQVTLSVTHGTLSLAGTTGLSFSAGDGTTDASMIFTGTLANINTALATLTYNPTANYNGAATLTLTTDDQGNTGTGGAKSDSDTVAITVNAVNDAPALSTTATTLSYTENAAATAIDGGLTVSDIDSANLASATVQITGNYQNGQDVLAFIDQLGITGNWNVATGILTLTGSASAANYQTALRAVTYRNTNDNPVTTTRTVSFTVNDGALDSNTATRNISLAAVNDDPVNSVPGAQATDEDTALVFSAGNGNQILIADVDAAGGSMQVTLSVTHGDLSLAGTAGLSFTTGDGTADGTMVFTGTIANINAALASLTYNPTANYEGAATLTLTTDDQGNTGTGGAKSDTDNISITINAINDAPVANDDSASTAPATPIDVDVKANDSDLDNVAADLTVTIISNSPGTSASVNPDGTINFDPGATTGAQTVTYQLTDPDGLQSGIATLTINVAANNLPTSSDASATFDEDTSYSFQVSDFAFSDADGAQTLAGVRIDTLPVAGTLTLSGVAVTAGQTITTANITNLLFTPATNANGTPYTTFTFSVQDSFGGYDAAPDTFTLNVDAVNDAPVNNLPAAQNRTEDNSLTLSSGNGNAISITDVDAGGASIEVTLSVSNGTLTLAGIGGLSFTTGDGSADTTMVFTGTLASINTALDGLVFAPTSNFNGTATLTLTTNDQGNTGSGGAKTDTDNLTITVDAVNDAPVLVTTVSTLAYTENAAATAIDSGLTVNDVDSANLNGATIQISSHYQIGQDVLAFTDQNGISGSWNSSTGMLTLTGSASVANYQTALRSITYQNNSNAPSIATRTVSFMVSDGSLGSNIATRDISVANVNDAPVATIAQPSYSATEQTNLALEGTGLSITDVDAAAGSMSATLSVVSGSLTVAAGSTGVVVGGSGTSSVTLTGTLTQINNLLAGSGGAALTYLINSDTPPATDTLTLAVDDNGNTGSGGSLTDSQDVTINISAVNDAPVNTVPGAQSVAEQAALVFSSGNGNLIAVADADAGGGSLEVTLSVGHGSLTLSGTTGLSFTTGDGTSDTTLVFSGTVADINAALAGMSYTGDVNFNGADTLTLLSSDQGNTGAGGTLTDTDTVAITISAVNDAPVATIAQPSYSATEQTNLALEGTGLSITDVDAAAGSMSATLSVVSGSLTVAAGSTGVVVGGSGTSSVTLTGTLTQINNLLAGSGGAALTYLINSDTPPATDTLTLAVDDNGNTGSGGSLTDSQDVTINISAVNDAPVNTVPGAQSVAEQAALVFSSGNGNLIAVADADAGGGSLEVTLSVGHGSLTLSGTTGLSFTTGDGTSDTTLVFSGTVADINAALAGMSYTGDVNFNGADTLTLLSSDQGNTGAGGTLTDTDTVAITISAVNDAPVATIAQPSYSATEQTNLALEGTGLSITDVDAAAGSMSATLSVVSGSLTVAAGSTGVVVGGSGTSSVTLTGTLTQINNLLAGSGGAALTYLINSDTPPATDTLTLAVDDNGNTGSGGSLTDSQDVTINISAVNDAPVNTVPGAQSVAEQAALVFSSGNGNLIAVADADAGGGSLEVTLSVGHGSLTLSGTTGLSFTTGDGTSDTTLVFSGTVADINAALAGMSYTGDVNFNGADTLTLLSSDQGNTGAGGTLTDTDTVAITISAVNDAPVATIAQPSYSATEQTNLALEGTGLSITDVDAAAGSMSATLSVVSGSLTVAAGSTGVVVGGSGTSSVTLTGTLTQINNLLAGSGGAALTYLINSDTPPATDTLTLAVDDNGNTGSGGSLTDSQDVTINISAVNDAPVNTVPGAQSVAEQAALVFSSGNGNLISVADADAGGGSLEVTLSVGHGSLTLSGTTGLSFTTGDGTSDTTLVFSGAVADINAALAGMSYTGDVNFNGADTLTLLSSDQGNTGAGGTLTDTDTVAITISAVNDAPVATIAQPSYSATEQTNLALEGTGLSITDVDAAAGSMSATLSVVSGSLTVAAGSTGVVVGGSGTSSVTLTGTLTQINNLLAGSGGAALTYLINSDTPPATDTLTLAVDDNGNTGSGGSLTDSQDVTINISAVNDAPVITSNGGGSSASISIAENATTVTTVTASDLEGDTLTYSIGGGTDAALFTIDSSTGVLSFNTAPDFESPADAGGNNVYDVIVTVSDGAADDTQTLILTVTDVNEFSVGPISDANVGVNTVAENAANGSTVGITASASDADGTNNVVSYSLSNDAGGRFAIDGTTGVVTVADGSLLDYESAVSHDITIVATSVDGSSNTQNFTINVANVNDNPPVITSNGGGSTASISIAENSTVVTTVTSTDADAGATATYSIAGGADAALFAIDLNTGVLSFTSAPDKENPNDAGADGIYDVVVQVSDGSNTDSQTLSVTVTDVNEFGVGSISDADAAANAVAENAVNGSTVGLTVSATDADATNNSVTYSLSDDAGGRFAIDAATGVVTVADGSLLDYESATSHVISAVATSADGSTSSQNFTINITNVNDNAPVITSNGGGSSAAIGIAENSTAVTTVTSTDPDVGATANYSITGGADAALFTIDNGTGVLSFTSGRDYESATDADGDNIYDVVVQVSDGSFTDSQTLAVTVTPVNDNAPGITSNGGGASAAVSIAENNTTITTVTAADADLPAQALSYSISGGADASLFTIDGSTGLLSFLSAPDFETPGDAGANNIYDVTVQVSDGTFTDTQAIAVSVTNINEAPVITSNGGGASAATSTAENTTAVTTVTATDVDAGSTLTYSIAGGADAAKFMIDGSTGVLSFLSAPDFETPTDADGNNVYDVTVQVSDGTLTDTQAIAVSVTNVNEAPTITSNGGGTSAATSTAENTTAVTTVTATDVDAGSTLTYSISGGADAVRFTIDGSTGVLSFLSSPDFETPTDADGNNIYDVTIQVSDGTLIDTQAIAVSVTNVNEAPTITSNGGSASASVNVAENTTAVTTVTATDVDAGSTLTYSISGGVDAAKFVIDGSTGVLSFLSTPDFETPTDADGNNVYDVTVQVSDGTLIDTQAIAVSVTNVNEAPVITSNGGGTSASLAAAENTTMVTTVAAADVDVGSTLTYSIAGGADAARFMIDGSTGLLSFLSAPDFEIPADADGNNIYDVTVQVSDGSLTDTQALAITVTDVNDHAPVITSDGGGAAATINVTEDTTPVTTVTATDADGDTLSYAIVGGADAGSFTIDSSTGALTFASAPDFESPADANSDNIYDVIVQAFDGSNTDTQAIAVTVINTNEAAPVITSNGGGTAASVSVLENSAAVTTVTATDADGDTLGYTIIGGADAAKFTIDSSTGVLSFVSPPDYESPGDADANNVYDLIVQVSDGSLTDTQNLAVTVTPGNDNPPVITSDGGGATAAINVAENGTAVTTVAAADQDVGTTLVYAVSGGADAARFSIDATTGALRFISAPNFESPDDVGTDNVYDVVVQVSDGNFADSQTIAVTVTNINEAPSYTVPGNQTVDVRMLLPITGISAQDEDDNISAATLSVSNGVLKVSLAGGASVSAGQNDSSAMVLVGTQTQINAALATLSYRSAGSFAGSDTLALSVVDSGGAAQSASVHISVSTTDGTTADLPVLPPNTGDGGAAGGDESPGKDDTPPTSTTAPGTVAAETETGTETTDHDFDNIFAGDDDIVTAADADILSTSSDRASQSDRQHTSVGADLESVLLKQLDDLVDPASLQVARPGDVDAFNANSTSRITIGNSLVLDLGGLQTPQAPADGPFHISPAEAGSVVTVSVAAGIVWWASRSVGLLTALMASVPAWRTVDPLPILARDGKRKEQSELENALDPESTALTTQNDRPAPQPGRALLTDIEY